MQNECSSGFREQEKREITFRESQNTPPISPLCLNSLYSLFHLQWEDRITHQRKLHMYFVWGYFGAVMNLKNSGECV